QAAGYVPARAGARAERPPTGSRSELFERGNAGAICAGAALFQRGDLLAMNARLSRRAMLERMCGGLGTVGLLGVLAEEQARAAGPVHSVGPHFQPKAKHNIFLFMVGGPSQLDMFDPKPALLKHAGQRPPNASNF